MKANAKKLLALIMAMVMCLSLAAPAFAGYNKPTGSEMGTWTITASDTDLFATVTDLEYTAKKTFATRIEAESDGKGNYKVYGFKQGTKYNAANNAITEELIAAGNVKDSTQPDGVTVKLKTAAVDKIGQPGGVAVYTVSYKNPDNSNTADDVDVEFGKATTRKTIEDVKDSEWKDLSTIGDLFTYKKDGEDKKAQVKGSVYQEKQVDTGLVITYFKLAVAENGAFKDGETMYFVNTEKRATVSSAANMDTALAGAKKCNSYGEVDSSKDIVSEKCFINAGSGEIAAVSHYGFVAANGEGVTAVGSEGSDTVDGTITLTFATDVTSATFQVSVKDNTKSKKEKKDIYVTTAEEVQKIVEKALKYDATIESVSVESVTAASGNFMTVAVKAVPKSDAYYHSTGVYAKNVTSFNNQPVLLDQTAGGIYKAETVAGSNAKTIAANTVALGDVVVRKSDLGTSTATGNYTTKDSGNYLIFKSVKDIKVTNGNCADAKPVPYVQVVVNPWIGDKQNGLVGKIKKTKTISGESKNLVTDTVAQAEFAQVTMVANWFEDAYLPSNASFVKKGTVEVEAAAHSNPVETYTTTPATCQTPGTKVTKTVCGKCNQVISEKTEELPVDSSPVAKNTTDKITDQNREQVDKISYDSDKAPFTGCTHWIKKSETTTTLSEDKSATVYTTTFTCNYGVVHDELTRVVTVKKADLQHSGNWNGFKLGDRSALIYSGDGLVNMFGYGTFYIYDSDVENEALIMNRKWVDIPTTNRDDATAELGDLHFEFTGAWLPKNDDGTYNMYDSKTLKNVYSSATALPVSKSYAVKVTAKDIVEPTADCQPSSATLEADVYEVDMKKALGAKDPGGKAQDALSTANMEKNLEKGYITLKSHYSEAIQNRPARAHEYDEKTGICRLCNKGREVVESRTFTADTVTVEDLKWTGTVAQPKVVVKDTEGYILVKGIDYVVSEIDSADVGTYTLTIKGVNDYDGNRVNKTFKIVAASTPAVVTKKQTLKVNTKKKTFKVKNLKKKKASFKVKLSGAKTAVTWKSNNSKVTVKGSKTKATITVKKGTKKGTYKVTATAKKTSAYKKGTVTVKVIVK